MDSRILTLGFLVATMCSLSSAALADPTCGNWEWQADGSYWRQCVNDDGSQHCYTATDSKGANAKEIDCKK
jgi:hypothetical protein